MIKTVNLSTDITPKREVRVVLPNDVPTGPADLIVIVVPHKESDSACQNHVTEMLNQVYEKGTSTIDPILAKMQIRSIGGETW